MDLSAKPDEQKAGRPICTYCNSSTLRGVRYSETRLDGNFLRMTLRNQLWELEIFSLYICVSPAFLLPAVLVLVLSRASLASPNTHTLRS